MTLTNMNPIDRAAMLLGTGLMMLSVVVLGLIEVIAGKPYGAAPLTNDAGEVIAQPAIDPNIRTGLFILGLLVLLLWAIYKLASPSLAEPETSPAESPTE